LKENSLKSTKSKHRSAPCRASRKQHVSEAAEDYTELVADLIEKHGEARTCQIAENLGISHVTALRTIRRLQGEGYLETSPHRPVTLTKSGKQLAKYCKQRHQLLVKFFIRLGVSKSTAEIDVEGAEHHISPESLKAIKRFMKS